MPVSRVNFGDKSIQGVEIEPKCRAHFGVIELIDRNQAAVIAVNAGQVIWLLTSTIEYCEGYADGYNRGTGKPTPRVEIDCSGSGVFLGIDFAKTYAEWLDGQRRDIDGDLVDRERWAL